MQIWAGGRTRGELACQQERVSVWDHEKVREVDGGDGRTVTGMSFVPRNRMLTNITNVVDSVWCISCHHATVGSRLSAPGGGLSTWVQGGA